MSENRKATIISRVTFGQYARVNAITSGSEVRLTKDNKVPYVNFFDADGNNEVICFSKRAGANFEVGKTPKGLSNYSIVELQYEDDDTIFRKIASPAENYTSIEDMM